MAKKIDRPSGRLRKLMWPAIIVVSALVALVILAPSLLSSGPGTRFILSKINQRLNGEFTVDDLSLGWFTGIQLTGGRLTDADGTEALRFETITSSAGLLKLIRGRLHLGNVNINSPVVTIRVGESGQTNLTELVRPTPTEVRPPRQPSASAALLSLSGHVQIDNGSINIIDLPPKPQFHLTDINVTVEIPSLAETVKGEVSFVMASETGKGTFRMIGAVSNVESALLLGETPGVTCSLEAEKLDLTPLATLARPLGCKLKWTGTLNSTTKLTLQADQLELEGTTSLADFELFDGGLGKDRLRLGSVNIPHNLTISAGKIDVRELGVQTELVQANFSGIAVAGEHGWLRLEELRELELSGTLNIEVAKIATMLPNTLKLRKGLELTDGKIAATLEGKRNPIELTLDASLKQLRATLDDVELSLPKDATLNGKIRCEGGKLLVPGVVFKTGFAEFTGSGGAEEFTLNGTLDLAKLTAQLRNFVQLGDIDLAGAATVNLHTRGQLHKSLDVNLTTDVQNLRVSGLFEKPIVQPHAKLTASARLETLNAPQTWPKRLTLIEAKGLDKSDKLKLTAEGLTFHVKNASLKLTGLASREIERFDLVATADLEKAYDELAAVLNLPHNITVSGKQTLVCAGAPVGEVIEFDVRATSENLNVTLPGNPPRRFTHEKLIVSASADWNQRAGTISMAKFAMSAKPLHVNAQKVNLTGLSGEKPFNIDVEKFTISGETTLDDFARRFGSLIGLPDDVKLAGSGNINCVGHLKDQTVYVGRFKAGSEKFVFTRTGRKFTPIRQERLSVEGSGSLSWQNKSVAVNGLGITGTFGKAEVAGGKITDYGTDKMTVGADSFEIVADENMAVITSHIGDLLELPAGIKLSGAQHINCKGSVAGSTVSFSKLYAKSDNLVFKTPKSGKVIRQKRLIVDTVGKLDWRTKSIDLANLSITGAFGKVNASDVHVANFGTDKMAIDADVTTEAELTDMRRSFGDFLALDPKTQCSGKEQLTLKFRTSEDGHIHADGTGSIREFRLKPAGGLPEIFEPIVTLTYKFDYDVPRRRLKLQKVKLACSILTLDAAGAVNDCGKTWTAKGIAGTLDYDTAKMRVLLARWLPTDMQLAGRRHDKFTLDGPLPLAGADLKSAMMDLRGQVGIGFDRLATHGIVVKKLDNKLVSKYGKVHLRELTMAINRGRAQGSVYVVFRTATPILKMGQKNIRIEKMEMNEKLAQKVFKYVNPIFASGRTTGLISLECKKLHVPLDKNALNGANIHVRVGVDKLDMEVRGLLGNIIALIARKPLRIKGKIDPFDLYISNGKVHYTGLRVNAGDFDLIFSGSVGIEDKSVNLAVSLPLTEKLLGGAGGDVGKLLIGQRVTLPITGTISQTRLATTQLLEEIGKLLKGTLNRLPELLPDLLFRDKDD